MIYLINYCLFDLPLPGSIMESEPSETILSLPTVYMGKRLQVLDFSRGKRHTSSYNNSRPI